MRLIHIRSDACQAKGFPKGYRCPWFLNTKAEGTNMSAVQSLQLHPKREKSFDDLPLRKRVRNWRIIDVFNSSSMPKRISKNVFVLWVVAETFQSLVIEDLLYCLEIERPFTKAQV